VGAYYEEWIGGEDPDGCHLGDGEGLGGPPGTRSASVFGRVGWGKRDNEHDEVDADRKADRESTITPVEDTHNLFKPWPSPFNTILTNVDENGAETDDRGRNEETFRRMQE